MQAKLSVGPGFQGLILKPRDRYDVFHPEVGLNGGQTQGFCGRNYEIFPTQVCISIIATTGATRVVEVLIEGLDQFGFRASEIVRITADEGTTARVGTRYCYSAIYTFRKIAQQNVGTGIPTDKYSVGIGRSTGDSASPPARPNNSFRVPLLGRLRSVEGFVGLQSIDDGVFFQDEPGFELDLASQSIEILLSDSQPRFLSQVLDSRKALLNWSNA